MKYYFELLLVSVFLGFILYVFRNIGGSLKTKKKVIFDSNTVASFELKDPKNFYKKITINIRRKEVSGIFIFSLDTYCTVEALYEISSRDKGVKFELEKLWVTLYGERFFIHEKFSERTKEKDDFDIRVENFRDLLSTISTSREIIEKAQNFKATTRMSKLLKNHSMIKDQGLLFKVLK